MNYIELIVFIVYLICMLGVGVFFFFHAKGKGGEKGYFLGDRQMGPWVSALSAGASDMSAWVLMGLPASVFAAGVGHSFRFRVGSRLFWNAAYYYQIHGNSIPKGCKERS